MRDQSTDGIDYMERRILPRSIHKLFGTQRAKHASEHDHWPVFRGEDEFLDTNVRGFTTCIRCAVETNTDQSEDGDRS